jgi:mRNA-degrading endonuclease toxin of MazEF toxin-antitoxin module
MARLSTVVVCPTSQSAAPAAFRPEVDLPAGETRVLCEMVGAIDVRALGERVGHLSLYDLAAVDEALSQLLGLA